MNRTTGWRLLVAVGVAACWITATATTAEARPVPSSGSLTALTTTLAPEMSTTMNRKTIKRILVTLGVTAGFITITASQASALGGNHSEPTLRPR